MFLATLSQRERGPLCRHQDHLINDTGQSNVGIVSHLPAPILLNQSKPESIGGDKNFFKQKGQTFELIFFNTTNVSGMVNLLGDIEEN